MPDVVLVSLPFGALFSPSIGLSLLKAELAAHAIPSTIDYFSIAFAQRVGRACYCSIANGDRPALTDLAGEWLFSAALFGTNGSADRAYINEILLKRCHGPETDEAPYPRRTIARLLDARAHVNPFLEECVRVIVGQRPKVLGFTSMFQQHLASLALAKRVKRALPSTCIVFGGANCEGVMGAETIRQFPFVDAVVSGEGDIVFPELARRVLASEPICDLPGVRTRPRIESEPRVGDFDNATPVLDLDKVPLPDYSDYFEQFRSTGYSRHWIPRLFVQTSRGCWWGERIHCTFCGLNGATTRFRSKGAPRVIEELTEIARKYPGCDAQAAENILDKRYFNSLLPALSRRQPRPPLFLETKSNLIKEHVRLLQSAGVAELQPGIESFSDRILKIMRKGVTALQNIQLLKWCKELGVQPCWNFLWGFPGEPPEEYARMARLVPLLTHLPPPGEGNDIRLDRFSPLFVDADRFGLTNVAPLRAYRHVYALPEEAVANLAYYFEYSYRERRDVQEYVAPLVTELAAWQEASSRSDLFSVDVADRLIIWDLRPISAAPMTVLTGLQRALYAACDAQSGAARLAEAAASAGYPGLSLADITRTLQPLVDSGLILRDASRYLALAIPLGDYKPTATVVREFRRTIARLGTRTRTGWIVPLTHGTHARRRHRAGRGRARAPYSPVRGLRTLMASQFAVDGRGRLVIQAAGVRSTRRQHERTD